MLGPVEFGDFATDPSSPTAWIAFAPGALALILLVLTKPGARLSLLLRSLWTLSFAAFVVHLWSTADPARVSGLSPLRVQGMPISGLLLAAIWAVTVVSAWTRPAVLWPQAIILLVLSGAVIATTILAGSVVQWIIGASFAVALIVAVAIRMRTLFADIAAIGSAPAVKWPAAPDITPAILAQQAWRDLHGKEVQCAATYSYLWLADQVGHVGLGMLVSIALIELGDALVSWPALAHLIGFPPHDAFMRGWAHVAGFAVAAAGVCYWEVAAYRKAASESGGRFPVDTKLLFSNAVIAATYMVIGAMAGWAFRLDFAVQIPILVALAFVGIVAAKPWVRQKIIWQKAGLPYLFRLAEAQHTILEDDAKTLQNMVTAAAPPHAPPQQVVIAGPIGSGRTLLACGIGTELAFCNKTVRYVGLDRLIEFATAPGAASDPPVFGDDLGPSNIDYWAWYEAQVLVIDDLGPVLHAISETNLEELLHAKLKGLQERVQSQHSVWIIGDIGEGEEGMRNLDWHAQVIRKFCDGHQAPTRVLLCAPDRPNRPLD
jgi:hypothetical protein